MTFVRLHLHRDTRPAVPLWLLSMRWAVVHDWEMKTRMARISSSFYYWDMGASRRRALTVRDDDDQSPLIVVEHSTPNLPKDVTYTLSRKNCAEQLAEAYRRQIRRLP